MMFKVEHDFAMDILQFAVGDRMDFIKAAI